MYLIYSNNISSFFNTNPFPHVGAILIIPFAVTNEFLHLQPFTDSHLQPFTDSHLQPFTDSHLQPFTDSHFRFVKTVQLVTSQTSIQRPQQVSVASSDPSALGLKATQHSARSTEHLLLPLCPVFLDLPSHCLGPARSLTLRL